MKNVVERPEEDDIELDVLSRSNATPSEFRQLLDSLNASIKKLDHFRGMAKIMAQSLDSMDVHMLTDQRAQLLGHVTADTYTQMLSMIALQMNQVEMLLQAGQMGSGLSEAYEKMLREEMDKQLEGALPEYMQVYLKKMEGKPIRTVLHEAHSLLADLNAKILVEFNPTLTSTKYAISFAMQKIFTLSQICSQADPSQKHAELLAYSSAQMVETFKRLDQLFEGKVQLTGLANLMTRVSDLVQFITSPGNTGDELIDFTQSDISKLLLSLIPIQQALSEAMLINQIKMLEVSAEFYEAVKFSQKPTPNQQAKLLDAMPKLLRLMLATQNQQIVNLAWAVDKTNFFTHFFELVNEPELQAEILKTVCEQTLLLNPTAMIEIYQQAQVFCTENADHPGVPLIQQLGAQYASAISQLNSNTSDASVDSQASLQQASFTRFLKSVMDPSHELTAAMEPAQPQVSAAEREAKAKILQDMPFGPGF